MRLAWLAATVLGIGLGCNNPSGGNTCKNAGADVTIEARDQGGFSPTPILVNRGQTVCWENAGSVTHTVTTVVPATDTINQALPPSSYVEHTFTQITDIDYYCTYHQQTEQAVIQVR